MSDVLQRLLEPELMDTAEDARQYDAIDHAAVNALFVSDLLAALADRQATGAGQSGPLRVLDLGAGTAQIAIELCRREPRAEVTAVDAAGQMLALARANVAAAGLADRIELLLADAKQLPLETASFPVVVSNSILHHIAEPRRVLAEVARVCAPGGLLFHRDLARPGDEAELDRLVAPYAAGATGYQRRLLADSFRAALTLAEARGLVAELGYPPSGVAMTSDRHWTWSARAAGG